MLRWSPAARLDDAFGCIAQTRIKVRPVRGGIVDQPKAARYFNRCARSGPKAFREGDRSGTCDSVSAKRCNKIDNLGCVDVQSSADALAPDTDRS